MLLFLCFRLIVCLFEVLLKIGWSDVFDVGLFVISSYDVFGYIFVLMFLNGG